MYVLHPNIWHHQYADNRVFIKIKISQLKKAFEYNCTKGKYNGCLVEFCVKNLKPKLRNAGYIVSKFNVGFFTLDVF